MNTVEKVDVGQIKSSKSLKNRCVILVFGFILVLSTGFLSYGYFENKNIIKVTSKAITDWSRLNTNDLNLITLKFEVAINPLEVVYFNYILSNDVDPSLIKNIKIGVLNFKTENVVSNFLVGIEYDMLEKDFYKYLIENPDAVRVKIIDRDGNELITSASVEFDLNKISDSMAF